MNAKQVLVYFAIKYNGDWDKIYSAISNKEMIEEENFSFNGDCITIMDNEYPFSLKQSYKPPFVLFYKGDIKLIEGETLCITGTRETTTKGICNIQELVSSLDKNTIVVNGDNKGTEKIANEQAKINNLKTICVLGCGLDKQKTTTDLTLTEYPLGVNKSMETAGFKNRIIAAISKKIVIGETTNKHSNTYLLASMALQNNKEIFVIPEPFKNCFGNDLIVSGATPLLNANQLREEE